MAATPATEAATTAPCSPSDIYERMRGSWEQVSRDIRRLHEESRSRCAGHYARVARLLKSCASDCLPDDSSRGSGVWQVTFAVRDEHGQLQSFPLLLVPQALCDSVSHSTYADTPLHLLRGARIREWIPSDPAKPLRLRHAFVVHVCDLLVRPFRGIVATTVQYDLENLWLKYIVDADRVDAKSVSSFLSALAQAKKDNGKQPADPNPGSESQSSSSSSSNTGDGESDASNDPALRDAFCPITLGTVGLRAAHMCHISLGQQVYSWIMESLADECMLSKRYDLTPWKDISTWDINSTTNSIMVHPGLKISDKWTLLPQVPSDVSMQHLVFPTNCTIKCTFWDDPEPRVDRRYVFLNFQPGEIAPTVFKYAASIHNLPERCGNLTGITPVFVEKKRAREEREEVDNDVEAKRRKIENLLEDGVAGLIDTDNTQYPPASTESPSPVASSQDALKQRSSPEDGADISTKNDGEQPAPPAVETTADTSQDVDKEEYLVPGPTQPMRPTHPAAPRLPRPNAPSSYWPDSAEYPPPIAWDAMCASRVVLHYGSFAVRCFESVGVEDVEALIAALSPQDAGTPNSGADAAIGTDIMGACGPSDAASFDDPARRADLGTVFLLSVLLLASCYSAAYGDDDEDDDEYLSLFLVSSEMASSHRSSLLSQAASVASSDSVTEQAPVLC